MKQLFGMEDLEAEIFDAKEAALDMSEEELDMSEEELEVSEADLEEFPALELELELMDGRSLTYEVVGVFVYEEKEYAALHLKTDTEGTVHVMQLLPGENDEIRLLPIEDDEEFEAVSRECCRLLGDEEN